MVEERIPYAKPSITSLEHEYVRKAIEDGWGSLAYSYIAEFEKVFAKFMNSKYAIATSSCTGALQMGLDALGIGPGDEVIIADINWIASVSPIVRQGAKPVFVDVDPANWCIDPVAAESAITSKTKAIFATHLYGNLADMNALLEIGERHGIPVIEDAAEALGSLYQGVRAGSLGVFGAFSFHGSKTVTTGEGGMFVTNDPDLYERVWTLSNHGRARTQTKQFFPEVVGFKYKMTDMQAALGLAQMMRVDELISRKQEILRNYQSLLADVPQISMNFCQPGNVLGAWMPTVVFSSDCGVTSELAISALRAGNVDARTFFHPLTSLPMFDGEKRLPISEDIASRAINLPSFHEMTLKQQERISRIIRDLL